MKCKNRGIISMKRVCKGPFCWRGLKSLSSPCLEIAGPILAWLLLYPNFEIRFCRVRYHFITEPIQFRPRFYVKNHLFHPREVPGYVSTAKTLVKEPWHSI